MFEIVRIVAVHPESNSVDAVSAKTGGQFTGVQVLCGMAGADHGVSGLMQPAEQDSAKPFNAQVEPARVIYGLMVIAGGIPLLAGFLPAQVAQILFADKNRFVWRHPADVYATVKDNADLEVSFPSGTFLRIGAAPAHEDLTGKDHDEKWAIARNLDSAPWVSLSVANAGATPHTTLTIDPSGNVAFYNAGNVTWHTVGNVTAQVDGNLSATVNGTASAHIVGNMNVQLDANLSATVNGTSSVHAKGAATITCDSTLNLTASGAITSQAPAWNHTGPFSVVGAFSVTGASSMTGALTTTSTIAAAGNITGAGKSLNSHTHGNVQNGSGHTAAPD